ASNTLAQAFYDDPHFRWIIRDDGKRMRRLERGFATFMRGIWLPPDESYGHERLAGAALWMPPGTWQISLLAQLRLAPATIRALGPDAARLMRALTFIERHHPHEPAHWYLPIIGV